MERLPIFSFRSIRIEVSGGCVMLSPYDLTLLGYTFRKDGRYFVLAERHKSRDTIGVYDARDGYKVARVSALFVWRPLVLTGSLSTFNLQRNRLLLWHCHQTEDTLPYGRDPSRYAQRCKPL